MMCRRGWLPLAVLTLALTGCIDQGEPDWWEFEGVAVEGSTLTGVKDGQRCTAEELEPPGDSLRLHFIDVGQGDAIWVQTPTGENILVDAGDGGFFGRSQGGRVVEAYLTEHGLPPGATLDAAIVSHAHSDHYGGFDHLFKRYVFQTFIDPGLNATTQSYQSIVEQARTRVGEANFLRPALNFTEGRLATSYGQSIDLFGPEVAAFVLAGESRIREGTSDNGDVNNTSLVLRLVYAGRGILLTGDIQEEIEDEINARFFLNDMEPRLTTHLLKVAHHGSDSSSTNLVQIFRDVPFDERYAVIQAGRLAFGTDVQLPREDTVFRLWSYMDKDHLFSTEADDNNKTENEANGDDHVLAVIRPDGSMYVCYNSQPAPVTPPAP